MADMFAPLVAQLKANPKTIVFTDKPYTVTDMNWQGELSTTKAIFRV